MNAIQDFETRIPRACESGSSRSTSRGAINSRTGAHSTSGTTTYAGTGSMLPTANAQKTPAAASMMMTNAASWRGAALHLAESLGVMDLTV